jgi:signal peptidase I
MLPSRHEGETMDHKWKDRILLFWRGWGFSIVIAILVGTSFKSAIADWNVVPTGSMKPTIIEGDRIFVNKLAYDLKIPYTTHKIACWGAPSRGDVVVFFSPEEGTRMVKRVIGLPGDEIAMLDNRLFINGKTLTYEHLALKSEKNLSLDTSFSAYIFGEYLDGRVHPMMVTPRRHSMRSFGPITVPEDHFFMMGDNRDNSADSRFFGFVRRDLIVGKATAIVISLDIHDYYRPRWNRFFTKLP